jgi:hypothetical protein
MSRRDIQLVTDGWIAAGKNLIAGSGIEVEDRGEHTLKGVPGEWRVYAVTRGRPESAPH